jgi:hypothetical protein
MTNLLATELIVARWIYDLVIDQVRKAPSGVDPVDSLIVARIQVATAPRITSAIHGNRRRLGLH